MSEIKPSYEELQERLARAEATLEALRRGEVDLVVGPDAPRLVRLKSLVEENERLVKEWQTTFDALRDAVCILDAEQRVVRCNRATERYFQRSADEMTGKYCWEIIHDPPTPISECPFRRVQRSLQRESVEMRVGERRFEVTVDPILDADNRLVGAVHIVSDITERKRAEEKIQEQLVELQRWYRVTLGREGRIIELKREVNELLHQAGQPIRYQSVVDDTQHTF